MGAVRFGIQARGETAKKAFENAKEQAQYERGYDGYTGTIAEKHNYKKISVPKGKDPIDYANKLLNEDDERIANKWGPAGCVLVEESTKTKAIKKAKKLAIKNQCEYMVHIEKVLTSRDTLEEVVNPKKLKSNEGEPKGDLYYFFGWASC